MKKLLFVFSLCFIDSFGQQKVFKKEIFDIKIMSIHKGKVYVKEYPPLVSILSGGKINDFKSYDVESKKIMYDYLKFARQQNIRFTDFSKTLYLPFELFFNEKGEIDYFVYGYGKVVFNNRKFISDSLNVEENKIFIDLSEDFCKNYKFKPKGVNEKFSINLGLNFGKEPRKASKKSISTIELAEKCDQPDTVKSLMLNKLYLESFPEVVFRFKNLEELDISDNYIEEISNKIWDLKYLKFLSLSGNQIDFESFSFKRNKHLKDLNLQFTGMEKLPKSLKRNKKLEILFLGNNRIVMKNGDFKRLKTLKVLNLYNLKISFLPKSIGKLKSLEELDLYHNELKNLPSEICRLNNLKTLAVANNQLWDLPKEINQMTKLQTIYAHHNRLNTLPNLPNLKLLDVGYNLFKVFPEQVYELKNLEEFDITNNQIKDIPDKLLALKNLQKVYFHGNEFMKSNEKSKELLKIVAELEERQVLVR
jgi:Leucine-rich repeat (LRR) protein